VGKKNGLPSFETMQVASHQEILESKE